MMTRKSSASGAAARRWPEGERGQAKRRTNPVGVRRDGRSRDQTAKPRNARGPVALPEEPVYPPARESRHASQPFGCAMTKVIYRIVQHDGGWAYKVGDVFSETFPSHDEALAAAKRAAEEQRVPDATQVIEYEDADGKWHTETALGSDRPATEVEDEGG